MTVKIIKGKKWCFTHSEANMKLSLTVGASFQVGEHYTQTVRNKQKRSRSGHFLHSSQLPVNYRSLPPKHPQMTEQFQSPSVARSYAVQNSHQLAASSPGAARKAGRQAGRLVPWEGMVSSEQHGVVVCVL